MEVRYDKYKSEHGSATTELATERNIKATRWPSSSTNGVRKCRMCKESKAIEDFTMWQMKNGFVRTSYVTCDGCMQKQESEKSECTIATWRW